MNYKADKKEVKYFLNLIKILRLFLFGYLCSHSVHHFQIRIQDVEDLTDKDFEKLGVTAIGLQLRVKQACRNQRQGN